MFAVARGHSFVLAGLLAILIHFSLLFLLPAMPSGIISQTLAKKPIRMHVLGTAPEQARYKADNIPIRNLEKPEGSSGGATKKSSRTPRKPVGKKAMTHPDPDRQKLSATEGMPVAMRGGAAQLSCAPREDKARKNTLPDYPVLARKRGNEGTVLLRCMVDANGNVVNVEIASGSGFRILDEAARKAAMRWHFLPALSDGKEVQGIISVPVEFRLE